jgi:hypothetical protein
MKIVVPLILAAACGAAPLVGNDLPRNASTLSSNCVKQGGLPVRIHVFEDFETPIEKRWWLRGTPSTDNLPKSLSADQPNHRALRAAKTKDFDRKMGDQSKTYKAVIFNPVPGPPMGGRTRLGFRYWLKGTNQIRVQIYSLSKNYHRHLVLTDLPQEKWQSATVDMTAARRPDGSGGPLSRDERIDDIQFYIAPDADLRIDDIVLYEAAPKSEKLPFPRRVIFTGWFDTGKQGREWPGDFEIVLHDKPRTWDAARSVINKKTGKPWIRVGMRGTRMLSGKTHLRFLYRAGKAGPIRIAIVDSKHAVRHEVTLKSPVVGKWSEVTLKFVTNKGGKTATADEIHFLRDQDDAFMVDDLLLFEPGS